MLQNNKCGFYAKKIILLLIFFFCSANIFAQNSDIIADDNVSQKPRPLIALSEVLMINAVVHSFDRFVLKEDYAQVSFDDIGNNFKKGFVWDNDYFQMNAFSHPYHGSLYFNAARANNLTFWQSIPFAFAGSFTWEFFGENSYPAINDFINTPIGGMALGEMTHRLSHLVLDDSKSGLERVGRETLAGIISPMDLLNRLLTGKAWQDSLDKKEQSDYLKEKFALNFSVIHRHMNDLDKNRDSSNIALSLLAIYGEVFEDKKHSPYDFFTANINFNILGNQPLINEASIIGILWGHQWEDNPYTFLTGIFQHFDFYNSNALIENGKTPYEFAETASFGFGFYVKKQENEDELPFFLGSFHSNFVILGESESDYYSVYERDYNFGSGYSLKLSAIMNFTKHFNAVFNFKTYRIFTWNNNDIKEYHSVH
ncbi:MAG: DUF3943 domain-containing protein, partial [Endomicrobium sp.]|nr:DUF3943 domain-containing protein [Endomicrobium sp.]